jgi:aconitase B
MPGAVGLGYSKSLQFVSALGSVVLIWDNPHMEFYHHSLQERIHYIQVNSSTLLPTIQKLRANDSYALTLARNLQEWFRRHLTFDRVMAYAAHMLQWYASRQSFIPQKKMLERKVRVSGAKEVMDCRIDRFRKTRIE